MRLLKVGAAVVNQTPMDWNENKSNILCAIDNARAAGVSVLCLPELCTTGYGCEDAFFSHGTQSRALQMLKEILPATEKMLVAIGLPLFFKNSLFDVCAFAGNGKVLGFVAKRFLAGDGLHYEPRWFKPWPEGQVAEIDFFGEKIPLGDLYFDCDGVRIGFEICEDAWAANRPGAGLAAHGVDIILNPSASHFAFGKDEVRRRFVMEGSRAFGVAYVYANLLGNEAGRAIYDGDALIAAGGQILESGSRFSYADYAVTVATIDIDLLRLERARLASFPIDVEADDQCISTDFAFTPIETRFQPQHVRQVWPQERAKEEEFTRAVGLALFDYLRKSRSRGFVVSLSGGADSSAVSCLVAFMVKLAVAELGLASFKRKLRHIPAIAQATGDAHSLIKPLLTCVYQSTKHSSKRTLDAAKSVAEELGADFMKLDVEPIAKEYVERVSAALGMEINWSNSDIALQNIQARVRSPSIWMIANLRNALLLATSNRSEAAVGYTTMDGDTSGGLSPIAGIDKAFLRRWLDWAASTGPAGLTPTPSLQKVLAIEPTAELRPPEANQKDEDDLMPYALLDAIEELAIRDKHGPEEVFQICRGKYPEYSTEQLLVWVARFFRLWSHNQWKRERYAPSFHVDDTNLDPKTWCRFPILSGNFELELRELAAKPR